MHKSDLGKAVLEQHPTKTKAGLMAASYIDGSVQRQCRPRRRRRPPGGRAVRAAGRRPAAAGGRRVDVRIGGVRGKESAVFLPIPFPQRPVSRTD